MSATRVPRLLVVGDVIDDVIVRPLAAVRSDTDTPARIATRPGGSGANLAAWAARAGLRVRFVGRVGASDVTRHAAALAQAGVEARLVGDPTAPTGTIVVLVDDAGHRTMLTDRGANLGLVPPDLPDALLDGADLVHVSGYTLFDPGPRAAVADLVARAADLGIGWSVDPSSVGFLTAVGAERYLDWIDGCAVVHANLDEGRLLTGLDEPTAVVRALTLRVPTVALTLGADGVLVATADDGGARVTAIGADPTTVIDPTGAGDAFTGGFLAGFLRDGDAPRAARDGATMAAIAVATVGARPPERMAPRGTV